MAVTPMLCFLQKGFTKKHTVVDMFDLLPALLKSNSIEFPRILLPAN
jgi:hypothetical protein